MARRSAIKLIVGAAAAPALAGGCRSTPRTTDRAFGPVRGPGPAGTPTDPDLLHPVVPWDLTLTEQERRTLAALCDAIIPADARSPAASSVGAHDFIDEWVSAPYAPMKDDREGVQRGLAWLDGESTRRFGAPFHEVAEAERTAICDDICNPPDAAPEFEEAARFFDKVRDLTAMAFYTTRVGMDDIGYVGNTPQDRWLPPPPEVLRKVGLD
jgi:hypothetical protein